MTLLTVELDFKKYLLFVPSLRRMFSLSVLTLSLWNGFKKLPAISPSSRGVPGGLFMPAMLLGEFCNIDIRKSKNTCALTKSCNGMRLTTYIDNITVFFV